MFPIDVLRFSEFRTMRNHLSETLMLNDIQITSDYMSRWVVLKRRVGAVTSQRVLNVLFYVNILQCFFVVENFTANAVSVAIGDNGNRNMKFEKNRRLVKIHLHEYYINILNFVPLGANPVGRNISSCGQNTVSLFRSIPSYGLNTVSLDQYNRPKYCVIRSIRLYGQDTVSADQYGHTAKILCH